MEVSPLWDDSVNSGNWGGIIKMLDSGMGNSNTAQEWYNHKVEIFTWLDYMCADILSITVYN